jgi:hypothetical protein
MNQAEDFIATLTFPEQRANPGRKEVIKKVMNERATLSTPNKKITYLLY